METIRKLVAFIPGPYKKWVLLALILVAAAVPLVLWLRARKSVTLPRRQEPPLPSPATVCGKSTSASSPGFPGGSAPR